MTMKKLIYFLALEAALLLGVSCDKESDNVPLYVNTWVTDSNSLLTFGGKSVDYGFYQINADKTFNLSFLANENVLEVLKTQILPRLEPSEKGDDDYIDEATESYKKELAERIKSVKINDAVIIIKGVYVVIPGKEDNVDLNIFMTKILKGMEIPIPTGTVFHLFNIAKDSMTLDNEAGDVENLQMKSLSSSGLKIGKTVDLSEILGE
jgi:hypothetical protein